MKRCFVVNQEKAVVAGIVSGTSLVMALVMVYLGRMGSLLAFVLLAALFGWIAAQNAAVIVLDQTGVTKTLLGRRVSHMDWNQVREAGVCGTNPLNKGRPEKTGRLYIYCSAERLDEDSRYAMILKWPPPDDRQLCFTYDPQRLEALRLWWTEELEEYNTGTHRL